MTSHVCEWVRLQTPGGYYRGRRKVATCAECKEILYVVRRKE